VKSISQTGIISFIQAGHLLLLQPNRLKKSHPKYWQLWPEEKIWKWGPEALLNENEDLTQTKWMLNKQPVYPDQSTFTNL
jgi:hypothetical protein